jgi:hypothetical protein
MSREDLQRFAARDWSGVAAAKEAEWLRRKRTMSPLEVLQLSDEMRRHAHAVHPTPPTLADRLADLEVHHRVSIALRAVASTTR